MSEQKYVFADVDNEAEKARLRIHERYFDPLSHEHLTRVGVADGWRCLDVGAGAGSVVNWLAERVGPSGSVVAADIDTRFLTDLPDNVEVRRLNILTDDLEAGAFDLIHCRTVLAHLSEPRTALERMVKALAPGGWLVAIDGDNGLFTLAGHPDAAKATELCQAWMAKVRTLGIALPT
jgi:2-polyprenyl-3-methyl-5-hydroxy-6-metoxy-1,4-benzoquinol methylase